MPYALRDKRTGEISVLKWDNPLCFLTEEELKSGEYISDHIERIEGEMHVSKADREGRRQ